MAQRRNLYPLLSIGEGWTEAVIRTYKICDSILSKEGIDELNSANSSIKFIIARREPAENADGPYTLVNVYVKESEYFSEAESIIDALEQRIEVYRRLVATRQLYLDPISDGVSAQQQAIIDEIPF